VAVLKATWKRRLASSWQSKRVNEKLLLRHERYGRKHLLFAVNNEPKAEKECSSKLTREFHCSMTAEVPIL
jgi:hypothetical protein